MTKKERKISKFEMDFIIAVILEFCGSRKSSAAAKAAQGQTIISITQFGYNFGHFLKKIYMSTAQYT